MILMIKHLCSVVGFFPHASRGGIHLFVGLFSLAFFAVFFSFSSFLLITAFFFGFKGVLKLMSLSLPPPFSSPPFSPPLSPCHLLLLLYRGNMRRSLSLPSAPPFFNGVSVYRFFPHTHSVTHSLTLSSSLPLSFPALLLLLGR